MPQATYARIIGTGSFVPDRVITNDRIARAIPGWPADKIEQKTGIVERRFLWDFDEATGRAIVPPNDGTTYPRTNVDMCEVALKRALNMSGTDAGDLDALFLVSLTSDEMSFCHDSIALAGRVGCRKDIFAPVVDSGCGGAMYVLHHAARLIASGAYRTVAVVASHFTSAYMDRTTFTASEVVNGKALSANLTMYLFGDGAGAFILRGDAHAGILFAKSGYDESELVLRRGGGALRPPYDGRSKPADHACIVDGRLVAQAFPVYMQRAIDEVTESWPNPINTFSRYYLHQANRLLVEGFARSIGLPMDRVAMHMQRYGNMSAAGTLVLLDEDLRDGTVAFGSGQDVLFAAIGAGVHYGALIVRL